MKKTINTLILSLILACGTENTRKVFVAKPSSDSSKEELEEEIKKEEDHQTRKLEAKKKI